MSRVSDALDALLSTPEGHRRGVTQSVQDAKFLSRVEAAIQEHMGETSRRRGEPLTPEQKQLYDEVKKELEARGELDKSLRRGFKPVVPTPIQMSGKPKK